MEMPDTLHRTLRHYGSHKKVIFFKTPPYKRQIPVFFLTIRYSEAIIDLAIDMLSYIFLCCESIATLHAPWFILHLVFLN